MTNLKKAKVLPHAIKHVIKSIEEVNSVECPECKTILIGKWPNWVTQLKCWKCNTEIRLEWN